MNLSTSADTRLDPVPPTRRWQNQTLAAGRQWLVHVTGCSHEIPFPSFSSQHPQTASPLPFPPAPARPALIWVSQPADSQSAAEISKKTLLPSECDTVLLRAPEVAEPHEICFTQSRYPWHGTTVVRLCLRRWSAPRRCSSCGCRNRVFRQSLRWLQSFRINHSSPFCSSSAYSALTVAFAVLSTVAAETLIASLISCHIKHLSAALISS